MYMYLPQGKPDSDSACVYISCKPIYIYKIYIYLFQYRFQIVICFICCCMCVLVMKTHHNSCVPKVIRYNARSFISLH